MAINKKLILAGATAVTAVASVVAYQVANIVSKELVERDTYKSGKSIGGFKSIEIFNSENEMLSGYFKDNGKELTMLLIHPFQMASNSMLEYVEFFNDYFDCNYLLIDMYGHGNSDGDFRKLGGSDGEDLLCWLDYFNETIGGSLILFGKEMGANVILNASNILVNYSFVKMVITDGAFSSFKDYLTYRLQRDHYLYKFPIVNLIQGIIKFKYKINIGDLNTVNHISNNSIPIIFIHNRKDYFVPYKHVFNLYNAAKSKKELLVIDKNFFLFDLENSQKECIIILKQFIEENL